MNQHHPSQAKPGARKARPKHPNQWVTGGEPMTRAQASYLKLLCEKAGEAFTAKLTKAQASNRIDALRANMSHLLERRAS